jgi:hypothetical protein
VPVCKADDATVTTYLGSEGSTFEKVKSPSNANKLIEMKTLWEANLDPFVSDMNDNDHNLLLVGDDLYLYVEHYISGSTVSCYLRCFNVSDGSYKGTVNLDYPSTIASSGAYSKLLMTDDAGNIVLVGLKDEFTTTHGLFVQVYNYDLGTQKFVTRYENTSDGPFCNVKSLFEPCSVNGDVTSESFSFSMGAWYSIKTEMRYNPALCTFSYGTGKIISNVVSYSSNATVYEIPTRTSLNAKSPGCLISVNNVDESTQLMQLYGSDYNKTDHSPIMLYQKDDAGNWIQKDKLVKIGDETVPYTTHCFGAFPVKLGDEELLILPYQFDSTHGTTFKVLHWADVSTLSSGLTELWSFPNQNLPFAYAADTNKIYKTERPKVLVSTYKNADGYDEAKVYAYMPGSFLGAYTIALSDEETAASTVTVSQDAADATYTLEGRSLTVNPDNASEQSPLQVALYSIAGQCVLSKTVTDSSVFTEDLTSLTPGLYLLRLNSATTKLALQ